MDNKNGTHVYFTLKGDDFSPEVVSEKLNIQPTESWIKGESSKHTSELKFSSWKLSTNVGVEYYNINQLVNEIIDKLDDKVETINKLKTQFNLESILQIVMYIDINQKQSTPFVGHDLRTINFLHQTRTETDVDIYRFDSQI